MKTITRTLLFTASLAMLCAVQAQESKPGNSDAQGAADYLASCAGAMTQKALIVKDLDKKDPGDLHKAIGHYYRLACAFSKPSYADRQYERQREKQMDSFKTAAGRCKTDANCIVDFVKKLDGQLLQCASYQQVNATAIGDATRTVSESCSVDFKP